MHSQRENVQGQRGWGGKTKVNYVKSYGSLACNKQKSIDPFGLCTGNKGRPRPRTLKCHHIVNGKAKGEYVRMGFPIVFHIILTASNQNQRIFNWKLSLVLHSWQWEMKAAFHMRQRTKPKPKPQATTFLQKTYNVLQSMELRLRFKSCC